MTGKTVEDAVEAACAALALSRDEVSVEIIDMPQKRLFSSIPAKVRVYVTEDSFSVKDLLQSRDEKGKENPAKQETGGRRETEKPKPEEKKQEYGKPASPEKAGTVEEMGSVRPAPTISEQPEKEIPFDQLPNPAQAAFIYLKDIAGKMQAKNLTFKAVEFDGGVKFVIDGDDAAILIGRRGETMDALQYLSLLVSNRAEGEYVKISLDVANYRSKRENTLESLAKRTAAKVQKTRRSQTLEPMNPYERRIVHSTIQEIKGVKSESVGEDPHRRVVVLLEGESLRPYNNRGGRDRDRNWNNNGGRRGDNRNHDRDRRQPHRDEEPKLTEKPPESRPQDPELEKNLYGKIEL